MKTTFHLSEDDVKLAVVEYLFRQKGCEISTNDVTIRIIESQRGDRPFDPDTPARVEIQATANLEPRVQQ